MSRKHRVPVLLLLAIGMFVAGCKKDSSPTGPSGGGIITVTGKVVNSSLQPVSGVPVLISGKASVNTDGNGAFTVASVTSPYDATVIVGSTKTAYIYRGLTRGDPTLFILGSSSLPNSANVSGSIYPASAFPQPAGRVTGVALGATGGAGIWAPANGTVSPGTYAFVGLTWAGPTTVDATLRALQWDLDASGLPTTYVRYGARSGISVTSGGTFAHINDTMSITPGTLTFGGSVTVPAGYSLSGKMLAEQFSGWTAFLLLTDPTNTTPFSYKTPDLSGGTVGLLASANKGPALSVAYASSLAPNSSSASLVVPAAPELSLPVNAAPSVKAGTQFSWNAFPGGMHVLSFDGPAGQPDYYIMTMAASDSLPSLTSAGLPLPASAAYNWSVIGFAPFASMDVALSPGGFVPAGFLSTLVAGTGSYALSDSRSFTTAP